MMQFARILRAYLHDLDTKTRKNSRFSENEAKTSEW